MQSLALHRSTQQPSNEWNHGKNKNKMNGIMVKIILPLIAASFACLHI
jgi:hypothetical protein